MFAFDIIHASIQLNSICFQSEIEIEYPIKKDLSIKIHTLENRMYWFHFFIDDMFTLEKKSIKLLKFNV